MSDINELVDKINSSKNFFDIIAVSYSEIKALYHDIGFTKPEKISLFYEEIQRFKKSENKLESFHEFCSYVADTLISAKGNLKSTLLDLLYSLDMYCPMEFKDFSYSAIGLRSMPVGVLNSNFAKDNVLIFPRFTNTVYSKYNAYLKRNGGKGLRYRSYFDENSVNVHLKNNIIVSVGSDLQDYLPEMYLLLDDNELERKFAVEGLSFVLFPVTNKPLEEFFDSNLGEGRFEILINKEKEAKLKRHYKELLLNYFNSDNTADLAIFPEMFMTRKILTMMKSIIMESNNNRVKLFFCGTIWENNENYCVILDSYGNEVCRQYKTSRFLYKEKYLEHLIERKQIGTNRLRSIDIQGIGRIFTLICKDCSNDNILRTIKYLWPDLVISPAYSPSLEIKRSSEATAESYYTLTSFCNACSARPGEEDIGYFCLPSLCGTNTDSISFKYPVDNCNKDCCKCFFVFNIKANKSMKTDEKKHMYVNWPGNN